MRAEDLAALPQVQARRMGREFVTHCPVHPGPDKDPSLNFRNGDIAVVFTCRSSTSCKAEDILRAWGLTLADVSFNGHGHTHSSGVPLAATYEYTDRDGRVAYRKHRTVLKKFWFEHQDVTGAWIRTVRDLPRHVYRRHTLIDERDVFITEGEKRRRSPRDARSDRDDERQRRGQLGLRGHQPHPTTRRGRRHTRVDSRRPRRGGPQAQSVRREALHRGRDRGADRAAPWPRGQGRCQRLARRRAHPRRIPRRVRARTGLWREDGGAARDRLRLPRLSRGMSANTSCARGTPSTAGFPAGG